MTSYVPGSSRFAPPGLPPERTRKPGQCSKCGRPLLFVAMDTGGLMPCDPDQIYGNGYLHLVVRAVAHGTTIGQLVRNASAETLGLQPHWGTCPCRPKKVPATRPAPAPTLFDGLPGGAP